MMIVTLQTWGTLTPTLSVHGDIVKIDLGVLLLEMNTEEFKNIITSLTTQAAEHHIYVRTFSKDPKKAFIDGDPYRE